MTLAERCINFTSSMFKSHLALCLMQILSTRKKQGPFPGTVKFRQVPLPALIFSTSKNICFLTPVPYPGPLQQSIYTCVGLYMDIYYLHHDRTRKNSQDFYLNCFLRLSSRQMPFELLKNRSSHITKCQNIHDSYHVWRHLVVWLGVMFVLKISRYYYFVHQNMQICVNFEENINI